MGKSVLLGVKIQSYFLIMIFGNDDSFSKYFLRAYCASEGLGTELKRRQTLSLFYQSFLLVIMIKVKVKLTTMLSLMMTSVDLVISDKMMEPRSKHFKRGALESF